MHAYGTPSEALERTLVDCAERLGITAHFFVQPTSILAAFGDPAEQRTVMRRVQPGAVDLEKLVDVEATIEHVARREVTPRDGRLRIDEIVRRHERYGDAVTVAAYGIVSAAVTRFFSGGLVEAGAALLLGLLVGALAVASARHRHWSRLLEFIAGLLVAFTVTVAPLDAPYVTLVSSLIVLLPGLTLTMAINELATRHLAAGAARLMYAFTIFLAIGFGVALGRKLGLLLGGLPPTGASAAALPEWTLVVALLIAGLGLHVLFRAPPRDVGPVLLVGFAAFFSARLGAEALGPELGACVGAITVGLCAGLYSLLTRRSAAVLLLPGIILLVPGSIGFGSLSALLDRDVLSGIEAAFRMFLVAGGLVSGLLVTQALLPKRRLL